AFTTSAVFVAVSCPFLARSRIMLSLVSTVGVTPGFHRTITVCHSGEWSLSPGSDPSTAAGPNRLLGPPGTSRVPESPAGPRSGGKGSLYPRRDRVRQTRRSAHPLHPRRSARAGHNRPDLPPIAAESTLGPYP